MADVTREGVLAPGAAQRIATVRAQLAESARLKEALAAEQAPQIAQAAEILIECFARGGKVLLFGNGGSASDAQHLAAEWTGRLRRERPGLPALALTANSSDLTAIGNDYGFERVFARQLEAHGRAGDVALAISTSGDSPNVLAAVEAARRRGLHVIALAGKGGGKLAGHADVAIVVPSRDTQRIQECHIAIAHVLADLVDDALFPGPA